MIFRYRCILDPYIEIYIAVLLHTSIVPPIVHPFRFEVSKINSGLKNADKTISLYNRKFPNFFAS